MEIERLVKRDRIDDRLARRMVAQQLDNETRLKRAHDRIDNRGDGADLESQVAELHRRYVQFAAG